MTSSFVKPKNQHSSNSSGSTTLNNYGVSSVAFLDYSSSSKPSNSGPSIQQSINALDELLNQASLIQEQFAETGITSTSSSLQRFSLHSSSSSLVNVHQPVSSPSFCSLGSEEVRKSLEELDAVIREYEVEISEHSDSQHTEAGDNMISYSNGVTVHKQQQQFIEQDCFLPPPEFDNKETAVRQLQQQHHGLARSQSDRTSGRQPPPSVPRRNPSTRLSSKPIDPDEVISGNRDSKPSPPIPTCNHSLATFSTCQHPKAPQPSTSNEKVDLDCSIETDVPSVSEILQKFKKQSDVKPIMAAPPLPKPKPVKLTKPIPINKVEAAIPVAIPNCVDDEVTYAVPYQYETVPLAQPPVANLLSFSLTDTQPSVASIHHHHHHNHQHPGSPHSTQLCHHHNNSPPKSSIVQHASKSSIVQHPSKSSIVQHPPGAPPSKSAGCSTFATVSPNVKKKATVSVRQHSEKPSTPTAPPVLQSGKAQAAAIVSQLQLGSVQLRSVQQQQRSTSEDSDLADSEDLPPPPPSLLLKPVCQQQTYQTNTVDAVQPTDIMSNRMKQPSPAAAIPSNLDLYGLPESELSNINGFVFIPAGTPDWKRAVLERRNRELVDMYLAQKAEEERERERWDAVPEWKRNLIENKQAKLKEESFSEVELRRNQEQEIERLSSMPEWKRNLLLKKKGQA